MTVHLDLKDILTQTVATSFASSTELAEILTLEKNYFNQVTQTPFSLLTPEIVEEIRVRFQGKKSPLQELLKSLKSLPPEERKNAGALINELKKDLEERVQHFLSNARDFFEEQQLAQEFEDITLPLPATALGSRHPISVVMRDLLVPFQRMGFSIVDGPELDNDFYNFEGLNISKDHPAREMQDTFFLASEWVLRTHTSNVQTHAMKERALPLKIVCPGVVYRNEYDMTHLPAFRQIECLVVDKGIHLGHLRYTINQLLDAAFGRPVKIRFRSSYFPFTEPSAEVDIQCQQCFGKGCRSCKDTGWSEIGGCGLVNKKVLRNCGIDADVYSGIAFGFGVERIVNGRFAIADLRDLLDGNVNFLKSFGLN